MTTIINTLANPVTQLSWMVLVIIIDFTVCAISLRNGVERITMIMMSGPLLSASFRLIFLAGTGLIS